MPLTIGDWEEINGQIVVDTGIIFDDGTQSQVTQDGIINNISVTISGDVLTVLVEQTANEPGYQLESTVTQTYQKQ